MNPDYLRFWPLDPEITYLNHGAFGSCSWPVLQQQSEWRTRMERHPIKFMDAELEGHLDRARAALAALVGAEPDDLAFVPNATTGVNTVVRSLDFKRRRRDPDHRPRVQRVPQLDALRGVGPRCQGRGRQRPLAAAHADEVTQALLACVSDRTRLAVISHVTSPTGLVFPIGDIVSALNERGIDTLVDGAHAPGMVALDIGTLNAAYYTGNAHKWLCTPKGSAFLHARRDRQQHIRPLVISHGTNSPRADRSRFRLEFDWGGTGDPTPYLSIPAALEFMGGLLPGGWSELQAVNRSRALAGRRRLLAALGTESPLAPDDMIATLAAVELPATMSPSPAGAHVGQDETYALDPLHDALFDEDRIEVPVYPWPHTPGDRAPRRRLLRVSAQIYNDESDYERLAAALSRRI